MYTKIKNTLSALTVALGVVAFGFGLGEPANSFQATPVVAIELNDQPAVVESTNSGAATPAARRGQGLKRHLAMPFISFSPLLPRRGA